MDALIANPPPAMSISTHRFAIDDVETLNRKLELLLNLYEEHGETNYNHDGDSEHIVGMRRRQQKHDSAGSTCLERRKELSKNKVLHL